MFMGLSMGINRPKQIIGQATGPTIWTGSYSYITPATAAPPNMGEIVHGDNVLSQMLFAKTDINGVAYTGTKLAIGDILVIGGTQYVLDAAPVEYPTYYGVYIEPETQKQDGVYPVTVYAGGAQPPFSPLNLFKQGEEGAWYDPSDLTTMFQDSTGTTPVTADGQPVGLILDKSGRNNHASQATAAKRPLYKTSGGLHWLQFDGVDDALATGNFAISNLTGNVFQGIELSSTGASIPIVLTGQQENFFAVMQDGVQLSPTGSNVGAPTYRVNGVLQVAPTRGTLQAQFSAIAGVLTVKDVIFGTATPATGVSLSGYSGLNHNGDFYSAIILGRAATTQEITDTEQWVAEKTGVTLP